MTEPQGELWAWDAPVQSNPLPKRHPGVFLTVFSPIPQGLQLWIACHTREGHSEEGQPEFIHKDVLKFIPDIWCIVKRIFVAVAMCVHFKEGQYQLSY
jgi:hypothetical protein